MKTNDIFKLLSDKTRLEIINSLLKNKDGLCVKEIADQLKMTHSAISHQLSKLELRDIVSSCRSGQRNCYKLEDNSLTEKIRHILKVT